MEEQIVVGCQNRMTVRIGVAHRPNPSMGQDDYSSVAVRRVGICAGMARCRNARLSNEEVKRQSREYWFLYTSRLLAGSHQIRSSVV
jgi:hypothetical protein